MSLADYITNKPTIHTMHLCIRPMSSKDIPALKEWMPEKSIYTYWGKGPGKTDKNPELLFEKPEKPTKSFHLGIEETVSGKVIGDLWIYLIENVIFGVGEIDKLLENLVERKFFSKICTGKNLIFRLLNITIIG